MRTIAAKAGRKWHVRAAPPHLVRALAEQLHIALPLAQVLVARSLTDPQQAYAFLHPSKAQLHDPFLFRQMPAAVERLQAALKRREKVLVYGDYDTDGITATALLTQVLLRLGFDVDYFIPHRLQEGYGLHTGRLEQAQREGFSLVVTVDCGTKETETAQRAQDIGLDLIVTDHHVVPKETLPPPILLNAQHPDSGYPDKNLSGVGTAYKLARALTQHLGEDPEAVDDFLDLVALGTIADVVPLTGENRLLVKEGLARLRNTRCVGLESLIEASQTVQDRLGVRQVSYQLAPRLNALGRLGDATAAVRLLLTENRDEAMEIASLLNEVNSDRQRLQESVLEDIRRRATGEPELFEQPVIVLSHPEWHRGVIGIVASKLAERYWRPVLLFAEEGEWAHGSARSIAGFHITDALSCCSELLERFGGHELAAGVSARVRQLPILQERLGKILEAQLTEEDLTARLVIDAEVRLDDLSEELIAQLAQLGPFGEGNPRPLFAAQGLSAGDTARIVGNGSLKLMLAQGNTLLDAIAFGQGFRLEAVDLNRLDVAFYPEVNEWRGQRNLQLNIVELRTGEGPPEVSDAASPGGDEPVPGCPVRKVAGKTLHECWKAFEQKCRGRSCVVLVDDVEWLKELDQAVSKARGRMTSDDPAQWAEDFAPEAVLHLCGRGGPDRARRVMEQLSRCCPQAELYLGVPDSSVEEVRQTLEELYPGREGLLELYRKIQEAFAREDFEIEDAVTQLRKYSRAHLVSGFQVFEELDLVERHADGERLRLRRVRARRDLFLSPTFRQGQALRQRWADWLKALQGPEEQLACFLQAR